MNSIFKRCIVSGCSGLSVMGVCQRCGFAVVCSWCDKVKQPDGTYKKVRHDASKASHGICKDCIPKQKGEK